MHKILVPLRAGVLSALGLVIAPVAYDLVRTRKEPLWQVDSDGIDAIFREMTEEVARTLDKAEPGGTPAFARAVDIGPIGQGYQVTVPLDGGRESLTPDALWHRFARIYREKYGYFYDDVPAELVNLRLSGRVAGRELTLRPVEAVGPSSPTPKDERPAFSSRRG